MGPLAGLAGAERYGSMWLLRSLAVDPAFRGQGIGTALLAAVLREARQLAPGSSFCSRPTLTTSSPDVASPPFLARRCRAPCRRAKSCRAPVRTPQTLMRLE